MTDEFDAHGVPLSGSLWSDDDDVPDAATDDGLAAASRYTTRSGRDGYVGYGGYGGYGGYDTGDAADEWGSSHSRGRGSRALPRLVLASLIVLASAGVGVGFGALLWGSPAATSPASSSPSYGGSYPFGYNGNPGSFGGTNPYSSGGSPTPGAGSPTNVAAIGAKVDPALVDINTSINYEDATGAATGIVLTANGEVLTNNHVINGESSLTVRDVGNGKSYSANVVGYDIAQDLAVMQLVNASGLTTVNLGNSSDASVNEPVVAIGNAGGDGGTPTSAGGSITGLNVPITASDELNGTSEQLTGLIGVNADVQPGDSGGPLVNASGQVLGLDVAASAGGSMYSFTGGSTSTQGYAIPVNSALAVARQIEAGDGSSAIHIGQTAYLGVIIQQAQSGTAGLLVDSAVSAQAAQKAGIVAGDVITTFNGSSLATPSSLTNALLLLRPGDVATLTWVNGSGASHTATVVLGSGPPA
jgi:S1-C subfamily serine protease